MKSARSQNYSRPSDPNWAESVFCMFRRMPQSCWWRSFFYVKRHAALHFLQTEGGQEYKRKETRKAKKGLLFARSGVSFVVRAWNRVSKIHLATHDWLRILFFPILPPFLHKNPEKKGIIVSKVRVNYYSGIGIQRIIVPPLYTHNKNRNFSLVKPKIGVGLYHHALHTPSSALLLLAQTSHRAIYWRIVKLILQ